MKKISVDVLNIAGNKVGSAELSPNVFGADVKPHLVREMVRYQLSKRRAGTHQALNRDRIGGSGKKPFRQKGTGMARAGSKRSPLWRGGAVMHGPNPRKYDFKLTRSVKRAALSSVLTDKLNSNTLVVVDKLDVQNGKTKEFITALEAMRLDPSAGVSVIAKEGNDMLGRALGNIKKVDSFNITATNVYDLLKRKFVVIEQELIPALEERILGKDNSKQEVA